MANIFPPNTNRRFYGGVALIALAAALALDGKMPARDVDGRKVRKIMEDRGAVYAEV